MKKGWRNDPAWVRIEQERRAERASRLIKAAQARAAQEMAEMEREQRRKIHEIMESSVEPATRMIEKWLEAHK